MNVLSKNAPIPTQAELDAHYGYVYRITNKLTGRLYIGQHHHSVGEPWREYLGSGLGLTDERSYFGDQHFSKHLLAWGESVAENLIKEKLAIALLVESGAPHSNIEDAALYATTYPQKLAIEAFRHSFTNYPDLRHRIELVRGLIAAAADSFDTAPYEFQLAAYRAAYELRRERVRVKKSMKP